MKQILRLKIEKMAMGGYGIAYSEGKAIFVPYTVPGDEVEIVITHQSKDYAFGKVISIISAAETRREVNCASFATETPCGGCDWLMLQYPEQLQYKYQLIKEVFLPFVEEDKILPGVASPKVKHYRNKVFMPVSENRQSGKISYGFYERFSHRIVEHQSCENHPPIFDLLVKAIMEFCLKAEVKPYNENKHQGQLRHIGLRCNSDNSQILVILVTLSSRFPFTQLLVKKLTGDFPQIKGIIQNINRQKGNVILGDETKLLYGSENITDNLGGINFRLNYRSFWQINTGTMELIIQKIRSFVHKEVVVLDAYCGIGTIGISLAAQVKKVILLEELPAAIEDAKENAVLNNVHNAIFSSGKVEDELETILKEEPVTTLILDPPRGGVPKKVWETILQANIKQIIYLSCYPMTLARDVKILLANETYTVESIQPFDMFPNTWHIECLALLKHND